MRRVSKRLASSFAATVFRGRVAPKEISPFPRRPLSEGEGDSLDEVKTSIIENFKGSGALGLRIAEPFGSGLPHTALAHVLESTAASLTREQLATIYAHTALSYALVDALGNESQKRALLQAMGDGTALVTIAAFEEACGRDVSASTTEAEFSSETNAFTLRGRKDFVTDAATATHFLVFAKTETMKQVETETKLLKRLTCFVVPRSAKGVAVADGTSSVTFTDVALTPADVLGVAGDAYKDLMIALHTHNYVLASAALGLARGLPARALTAAHQCQLYAAESAVYALTANIDKPVEDSLVESALVASGVVATVASIVSDAAPTPTTWSTDEMAQLRRVTAQLRDLLGQHESTNALRRVAATCGVEEFGLYFSKASTTETIQLRTLRAVGVRDRLPVPQSQNVSALEALIVKFSEATESVFVKYAQRALHQGLLLQRLADGASLIYLATCALSRAQAAATAKAGSADTEKILAELFTHYACSELKTLCTEVTHRGSTSDETYGRIAIATCERHVAKLMVAETGSK